MDRRRFLGLGTGGAMSAMLSACQAQDPPPPNPEPAPPPQAKPPAPPRKVKSVIWLWMGGGQCAFETWDPKPGKPAGGGVKAIDTNVPGIRVSERLRLSAGQMNRLSLVRSVSTYEEKPATAEYLMHCGIYPNCADSDICLGTILAYELWDRQSGAPPFVAIHPPRIPVAGPLGSEFLPVDLTDADPYRVHEGSEARRTLLAEQEQEWTSSRIQRSVGLAAPTRAAAFRRIDSTWRQALDVTHEPAELRATYGPGFGQSCLKARRLVRAGVAVVEIGLHGWDDPAKVPGLCTEFDAGFGTLIRDLGDKEMLRDTVVIGVGPFGRSPRQGAGGVRNPWAGAFTVVLAGGTLAGGRVVGDTGPDGDQCQQPVPVHNLFATLFQACGVDGNKKYDNEGRKVKYVSQNASVSTSGTALKELF